MPILALGKYTVVTTDGDGFVRGQAVTFTYVPWYLSLWLAGAGLLGLIVRALRRARASYSAGRYLVLVPAVIGIVLAVVFQWNFLVWEIAVALETVTAVFLLWLLFRIRNWLLAGILALISAIAVFGCHSLLAFMSVDPSTVVAFAAPIALGGGMIAAPIVGIRLAIRKGVTWERLLGGGVVGLLLFLGFGAVAVSVCDFPAMENALYVLAAFFMPGIVLAGLIRWNAWARDVATGAMFRKK